MRCLERRRKQGILSRHGSSDRVVFHAPVVTGTQSGPLLERPVKRAGFGEPKLQGDQTNRTVGRLKFTYCKIASQMVLDREVCLPFHPEPPAHGCFRKMKVPC